MLDSKLCIDSKIDVVAMSLLKFFLYDMGSEIIDPGLGLGQDEAQIIAII